MLYLRVFRHAMQAADRIRAQFTANLQIDQFGLRHGSGCIRLGICLKRTRMRVVPRSRMAG